MLVLKVECKKCGELFDFAPQDYSIKGLENIPKRCPKCCDTAANLEKIVLSRREIERWEGVFVENNPFASEGREEAIYNYFSYGGRNFGNWGGASFTDKTLIYIHKSVLELPKPWIVTIRKMEKTYTTSSKNDKNIKEYFVMDPCFDLVRWYLYEVRSWHKTTLKGFGKDRNYREYLVPLIQRDEKEEINIIELISTSSGARSGRYGNNYAIYLADRPCKIEGEGD